MSTVLLQRLTVATALISAVPLAACQTQPQYAQPYATQAPAKAPASTTASDSTPRRVMGVSGGGGPGGGGGGGWGG